MTSNQTGFTVVTPSHNQAQFLEHTLRSVLEQDVPNVEYMVLDGGSTDGSVDILRRYERQLSFWRSEPDGGQTAAVNWGWQRARGQILAWLNSDDYYYPGALRIVADHFARNPAAILVYGVCEYVDPDGKSLGYAGVPFSLRTMIYSRDIVPQPSAFVRREAIELVGGLDESLNYSMDYDFFLRIAKRSAPIFIPQVLAAATIHPMAKTTKDRDLARQETHRVRLRHASRPGRLVVRLQPLMSRVFQALPEPIKTRVGELRPRRLADSPPRR